MTKKEIRKEKRKRKKEFKRQRHILYRTIKQDNKPFVLLYIIELILAFILEVIGFVFNLVGRVLCISLIISIIAGVLIYDRFYPTYLEYQKIANDIVTASSEDDFKISEGSIIYDSDGNIIANLYETSDQIYIDYEDIPEYVVNAFVAVEDQSFWYNGGIDFKGLTRIAYNFVKTSGDEVHGASTITQQLVKNIYLTSEVSIERKAKEMLISMGLTRKYSKNKIMEYYVNNICFANGIYGIGGASKRYFNKDVSELTLSECAYLCAIPNRPSYYDPIAYPENALDRRDKILRDMLSCGYISDEEYQTAISEEIIITEPDYIFNDYETTYAVDCAVKYLMKLNNFNFRYKFLEVKDYEDYKSAYNIAYEDARHQLYTGGYKIYTSLDMTDCDNLQSILADTLSFSTEIDETTGTYALQGALTVIDNNTGKVVALVGGRESSSDLIYSYNRAYQAYRQPGSTIKPLVVYTPALESDLGYSAKSTLYDIDVTLAKDKDVDVQKLSGTPISLRSAVEWSKNGTAWQIFDRLTPEVCMKYITDMQYSNIHPYDYSNSSSLGGLTYGVTTVEQAGAYTALANHGVFREPTCIVSILDRDDNEIYVEPMEYRIYDASATDEMVDILKGVITKGTASRLDWYSSSDIEVFGKTGTTNDNKDVWLCGSSPYYTISVWVGYDTPRGINDTLGCNSSGNIWKDSMLYMIEDLDTAKFFKIEKYEGLSSQGGYYSYLEGRDDNEVLSDGYTVADYRTDRVIGEDVYKVVDDILALDKNSRSFSSDLEDLYLTGQEYIDSIYSTNYSFEMQGVLDMAYTSMK